MKKFLCLMLSVLLLLTGCVPAPNTETQPPATEPQDPAPSETETPTEAPTDPTEEVLPTDPALEELRENLPTIDGSTSLIPLEAGIRAALFGKTIEEATADVAHSKTWTAFWNLLDGKVDMIFSFNLSQEQWDYAEEYEVALETVPIAKEGFVFVVNAENPVSELTQQQLRDIYSGKITNWSEVGGLDEEIIPYQRNNDSGSQNYMKVFMEDVPLMDAPSEMRPATMEGLMDILAINDNARGAIGYSVYTYAADMYGNGSEVKFIKVDGVAPSKATMATGEYPLMGGNFAVFHASEPEDGYVRKLVDWILSFDGQTALAKAGYVTVENIGFDYQEKALAKYQGFGTGPKAEGYSSITYSLHTVVPTEYGDTERPGLVAEVAELEGGMQTYRISGLANEALTEEINDFIDTQMTTWAWDTVQKTRELIDRLNAPYEYEMYSIDLWLGDMQNDLPVGLEVSCENGYLSVAVIVGYSVMVAGGGNRLVRTETATWDLLSGKRLTVEELFFQGTDIARVLNDTLRRQSQTPVSNFEMAYPEMKGDFVALTTTGWHMTHNALYIDRMNPYFADGIRFPLDSLREEVLVSGVARDFSPCLADPYLECRKNLRIHPLEVEYGYLNDNFLSWGYLDESAYPKGAEINGQVEKHITNYFERDTIEDYFATHFPDAGEPYLYMMDWSIVGFGGKYVLFTGSAPYAFNAATESFSYYPVSTALVFDLETGKQVDWKDLLKHGWEDVCTVEDSALEPTELPENFSDMVPIYIGPYMPDGLYLQILDENHDVYCISIPLDHVKL